MIVMPFHWRRMPITESFLKEGEPVDISLEQLEDLSTRHEVWIACREVLPARKKKKDKAPKEYDRYLYLDVLGYRFAQR